ncbi:hypothetical protein TNCV_1658701 [Trichonephila clavipes]|nr:hypothetical protein TNCV_1658701 [Trichonephila clavipes]
MSSFLVLGDGDTRNRWRDGQVCPDVAQGTMAPWARRLGCVLACYAQIGRGRSRDCCDLPIRRNEGRVVNTPLVFKMVLFQERKKKKKVGRERTEGEGRGDGRRRERRRQRRRKESREETERSPPCMEKRAESGIRVERR